MTKLKTLKVTRRQVELLRCLIYPRLRVERGDKDYYVLLHKLERLWKEPLYTGTGELFVPPKLSRRVR